MAIAQILSSGSVSSGGTLWVPAATQLLAFFGYVGSSSTWSYVRINGNDGTVLGTATYDGRTTAGVTSVSSGIYLAPPRSSTVTFTSSVGMTTAYFAVAGIHPVTPVANYQSACMNTSERYQSASATVTGTPVDTLVLGQHGGGGEWYTDTTADAHTHTAVDGFYANMPSDGSFTCGVWSDGSGGGCYGWEQVIALTLKPAQRLMGLLLD